MIRQPINDVIGDARRVILAGCGGGYDIFGAVPLMVELLEEGREVFLASLSFCYLNGLDGAIQNPNVPNMYEVPGSAAVQNVYCPEAWLSKWLKIKINRH
jgi:hypothetical protein